ncbi:NAD(P)H-binding protein [Nocardia otitidiscaviarum]|uniref:NAD(P)-dependent oxidoreductase n=1 Tax=Nocardia otitidiscaviarum TaxID=1823 RepID=UPI00189567C1|nr:NAD(P)H-binding protein [Nocardia otitidiscaviarum]MBF6238042.1 NAD(P)H-binding protein [Nocardia otitidiscaviarum]
MHITVFGAAGGVGSRVVTEALGRGHDVRAVSRNPERLHGLPVAAERRAGDASNPEQIAAASVGSDLVISATRPVPGREHELAEVAAALLKGLTGTGIRLLVVGGAGSLTVAGTGKTLREQPDFPAALQPIATACDRQLEVFRAADGSVDWTYLSPSALLEPGARTGRFRLGRDELLVDAAGDSSISMEDLAVALLDEAERPRHSRTRFTAGY